MIKNDEMTKIINFKIYYKRSYITLNPWKTDINRKTAKVI